MKAHVFSGERCIHCNVNVYDCNCPNDECCNEREPMSFTSELQQATELKEEMGG